MINVQSLSKSYGSKQVLKQIDLSFSEGKIHGIVGENGAGKSTLFRCIAGLEQYSGTIDYPNGNLKDVTGFLETNPYLLSKITGVEYLRLMCNARNIKIENLPDRNVFDLPLGQFAASYSTGMKKKLALTAILLQNNDVFILDEPFNGVDIQSNMVIQQVIEKLKSLGKIVILSSHIFSTLHQACDCLHHIKDGAVIASAEKGNFMEIEKAMGGNGIGNRIEQLGLK